MIDHIHALPEGYRLQEYTITGVLGFGGFGITYKALDNNLDKVVAIKEYLPGELAARADGSTVSAKSERDQESFDWGLNAFLEEAKTVAKFDHRAIVKIYRFFEQNGTAYIVMEFLQGKTLSAYLREKGTLRESEIRDWLWPVMEGLKDVHRAGVLHRDIKPPNIMMRDDGRPCLLDFGAARIAIGGRTRSLTAIMTPGYAPIEQYASRGNQGPWTDLYALAAVMYCCITGKKPHDAMDRVIDESLDPLESAEGNSYSPGLVRGIEAALSFRENERPQSLEEWLEILDEQATEQTRVLPPKPASGPPVAEVMPAERTDTPAAIKEQPIVEKRSFKWLYWAVPALVIAVVIGYWATIGTQQEKSDQQANSSPRTVQPATTIKSGINITGTPAGASVFVNGRLSGHIPLTLELQAGLNVTVRMEADGYRSKEQKILVRNMQFQDLNWDLTKLTLKYGLTIQTEPPDALVRILNIGPRYQAGMLLEPGSYQIEVSKEGYETKSQWAEIVSDDVQKRIRLSRVNSPEEQYQLGRKYDYGLEVAEDDGKAFEWYELAATNGHVEAQASLGTAYLLGNGVARDYRKAREWLEKGAAGNSASAQIGLGELYQKGLAVTQDESKAFQWYKKAADQGNATAQFLVGYYLLKGTGVAMNRSEALTWLGKSSSQGDAAATNLLEEIQAEEARLLAEEEARKRAPTWNTGDFWEWKSTGNKKHMNYVTHQTVTGRSTFMNKPVYEVKSTHLGETPIESEFMTDVETLNYRAMRTEQGGEIVYEYRETGGSKWPLTVGNTWKEEMRMKSGSTEDQVFLYDYAVEGIEVVNVPAGSFECFKLVSTIRNQQVGFDQFTTRWWSQEIKNYVRSETVTKWTGKNRLLMGKDQTSISELMDYRVAP
jgi:serine/threonine protein kinase